MKTWQKVVLVLAAIGAINVGLDELGWDAIYNLLGGLANGAVASVLAYLIGLSGIYALYEIFK